MNRTSLHYAAGISGDNDIYGALVKAGAVEIKDIVSTRMLRQELQYLVVIGNKITDIAFFYKQSKIWQFHFSAILSTLTHNPVQIVDTHAIIF